MVIASATSIWLISKHLAFFYHPTEQRHIVRLLFMPVIYAVCSFLSYYLYRQALYFQLLRDCYEVLVIASFFFLLLSHLSNPPLSPDTPIPPKPYGTKRERDVRLRESVKDLHLEKWMWPLGRWKWRPAGGGSGEGEAFLWWMRVRIGQYVLVRPLSTLASVIGEATGYYCLSSWSPKFVHIWSSAAICISVTVAICILQLYMLLKEQLKPYSPVVKFLCVKSVVFLTFWQESALSLLVTVGVIKKRQYWSADEIVIGLAALLSCFEMVLFAFLRVRAFTYLPYRALAAPLLAERDEKKDRPSAWDSLADTDAPLPLKRPKHLYDSTRPPPRRPDGAPMLQQTRRWLALLRVLDLRDLFVEIKEETKFVVRGGEIGAKALRRHKREEALKAVTDAERPVVEKEEDGERNSWEEEAAFERDDADLRQGDLAYMPLSFDEETRPSTAPRKHSHSGLDENHRLTYPWKDSLRRLRSNPRLLPSFLQPAAFEEEVSASRYQGYEPAFVPFLPANNSVLLPPPHRLRTPQLGPLPTIPRLEVPETTQQADQQAGVTAQSGPSLPSSTSSFAASSDSSYDHLPQTTFRPTSYVPAMRLEAAPCPPPFTVPPPTAAPPADPVPAFLMMASEASKRPQGLPPGAAAPAS